MPPACTTSNQCATPESTWPWSASSWRAIEDDLRRHAPENNLVVPAANASGTLNENHRHWQSLVANTGHLSETAHGGF